MSNTTQIPNLLGQALLDGIREAVREELRQALADKASQSPCSVQLLSLSEASKLLGVPKTWISAAAKRGEIPFVKLGHYVRFREEDLQNLIESRREKH